jgi:catalase
VSFHVQSSPVDRGAFDWRLPCLPACTPLVFQMKKQKPVPPKDPVARQSEAANELAASMPENENTPREFGREHALDPQAGRTVASADASATASTLSESNDSGKTGNAATPGQNPMHGSLDRVRVDATGHALTTNQGVAIADNQHSLRAGLRGPTLLEDFILREKITHFDHERIPERIVHARGSGAHGFFEAYEPLDAYTRAAPFAEKGKRTPVFVRFSTVAGERGSIDTARDVRGFAVKFYSDEGNWDLVGNNIPVFFIQDAIKFPDLVHSVKPEPHHGMPQAASAHDTFWDFVSLMPESTHMLTWVMSDRGIPRSYRMMQGFGVNTFRLINAKGHSHFVKFHWTPMLGTHSLVWDEAVKIAGADADFHRRDLWEAIERGEYPEWELGLQIISEQEADQFSFDILDATKIVPEELVPVRPVGRMVLNRNPENFFAETEQVAFCTAHVIPGIDFSNDPLLAGRIHSYVDTQISRLGGPNFHEIPINAPLSAVHNNQRDGMHRQAVHRGRVAYEPNSLGGGCPFQAGARGFMSFPEPVHEDKLRGKPEKFAEHYNQARLFYLSQTDVEQRHIVNAFRFELSKVSVPAIRERMVASLVNVHEQLAADVASGLGIPVPPPLTRATAHEVVAEVTRSDALSLHAHPGNGSVRSRKVAVLADSGVNGASMAQIMTTLDASGAVAKVVSVRLGALEASTGERLDVDATLENAPSVLFDGVIVADGAIDGLLRDGRTREFLRDAYRHGKTILALGDGAQLLEACGLPTRLTDDELDPGMLLGGAGKPERALSDFMAALGRHRHPERDSDPPRV